MQVPAADFSFPRGAAAAQTGPPPHMMSYPHGMTDGVNDMANNDLEALARALLAGRQGQSAAGALDRVSALLKTEDGRRLLTLLASGGADTIKTAAQAALRGDEATARAAMASLLGTREGAMLARRMAEAMNNGKR